MIIPTNLVYVLFDPAIPTSSFNFIQLFLYLYYMLSSEMEKSALLLIVLYVYVVLYVIYTILWFHLIKLNTMQPCSVYY